jgi:hypothetical protein
MPTSMFDIKKFCENGTTRTNGVINTSSCNNNNIDYLKVTTSTNNPQISCRMRYAQIARGFIR